MLYLTLAYGTALLVGQGARVSTVRTTNVQMMPKFLKELGLEKPDFPPLEALSGSLAEFAGKLVPTGAEPIEVREPTAAIVAAGKGMPLLSPIFSLEADLQAAVTNLGSWNEEEVRAEIATTIKSAPVVVYTYGLSPFSTEVVAILDSTGCKYKTVELGAEVRLALLPSSFLSPADTKCMPLLKCFLSVVCAWWQRIGNTC